jgi:hypothetical protein
MDATRNAPHFLSRQVMRKRGSSDRAPEQDCGRREAVDRSATGGCATNVSELRVTWLVFLAGFVSDGGRA